MTFTLAWLAIPLLIVALIVGAGLLVRAVAGGGLPWLLVAPTGAMTMIIVATAATWSPRTAGAAGPVLVIVALAGFLVSRSQVRAHMATVAGTKGACVGAGWLTAFGLFGASIILTGRPGFTGYTQIVDIGHQFDFAAYLARHGRSDPLATSSSLEVVHKLLRVGYPSGSQSALGAVGRMTSLDVAWIYQPYVAVLAATLVFPVVSLLAQTRASLRVRVGCAVIAAQPSLLVAYGQMGGVKEIAGALAVLTVAALLLPDGGARQGPQVALPVAIAMSGGFAVLSLTLLPWLGMLGLCLMVTWYRRSGVIAALRRGAWLAGLFVVLSLPTLVASAKVTGAASTIKSATDIGNLAEPISPIAAAGVWLTADHRFPLTQWSTLSVVADVAVLLFASIGALWAVRERSVPLVGLSVSGIVAFAAMLHLVGPWVQLKAFVITGPIVLVLAIVGALSFKRTTVRLLVPGPFLIALATLVMFGNALRYHDAALAPYARLDELAKIGERFAGAKGALAPDFEETAEYFLRREAGVSQVNPPAGDFELRPEIANQPQQGPRFVIDLDQLAPNFVQRFELLVVVRDPSRSRPPSDYRLVFRGRFYEVWRRSGPRPLNHYPLSGTGSAADRRVCREVAADARRTGRTFVTATSPLIVVGDPSSGMRSPGWVGGPNTLTVRGPGRATFGVSIPESGSWTVALLSDSERSASVSLDGRFVGRLGSTLSYPGVVLPLGRLPLAVGQHVVSIVRPGGSLAPGNGDGNGRQLGPVVFAKGSPDVLYGEAAERACAGRVDWVEQLRR